MKTLFEELKNSYICRKKRSQMIKTYLSGRYFQFDSDNHVSFCQHVKLLAKDIELLEKSLRQK